MGKRGIAKVYSKDADVTVPEDEEAYKKIGDEMKQLKRNIANWAKKDSEDSKTKIEIGKAYLEKQEAARKAYREKFQGSAHLHEEAVGQQQAYESSSSQIQKKWESLQRANANFGKLLKENLEQGKELGAGYVDATNSQAAKAQAAEDELVDLAVADLLDEALEDELFGDLDANSAAPERAQRDLDETSDAAPLPPDAPTSPVVPDMEDYDRSEPPSFGAALPDSSGTLKLCEALMKNGRCCQQPVPCPVHAPAAFRCMSCLNDFPEQQCTKYKMKNSDFCAQHQEQPNYGQKLKEWLTARGPEAWDDQEFMAANFPGFARGHLTLFSKEELQPHFRRLLSE